MEHLLHPANNILAQIIPMGVGGAGKNGINISLKNVHRAYVVCVIEQGADGTRTRFSLRQSTGGPGTAAGTLEKAISQERGPTSRLASAAKILGIRVLDHVVFGETEYFSFASWIIEQNLWSATKGRYPA